MRTTKQMIRDWLIPGEPGATHMIVACDTFDHEDYPIYVKPEEDVKQRLEAIKGSPMHRIMEVYSYALPLEAQLDERRAFNL